MSTCTQLDVLAGVFKHTPHITTVMRTPELLVPVRLAAREVLCICMLEVEWRWGDA